MVYEDFLINGWYATCKRNIFLNKAIRERNGKPKKRYSNSFSLSVTYDITTTSILNMVLKKLYKTIDLKYIGFIYKLQRYLFQRKEKY